MNDGASPGDRRAAGRRHRSRRTPCVVTDPNAHLNPLSPQVNVKVGVLDLAAASTISATWNRVMPGILFTLVSRLSFR